VKRVCKAVACAETSCGTRGAALSKNNAHGIMAWKNGQRYLRTFKNLDESYKACEELWDRVYQRLPDHKLAKKYTGNDHPETWLKNFYLVYNNNTF